MNAEGFQPNIGIDGIDKPSNGKKNIFHRFDRMDGSIEVGKKNSPPIWYSLSIGIWIQDDGGNRCFVLNEVGMGANLSPNESLDDPIFIPHVR